MSDDVKARLAAVRCDAAPYGWSDKTRGGYEIVEWLQNGVCGFVGIVRDGHLLGCMEWSDTGGNTDVEDGESVWDLVPLPAPVAVQDEQAVEGRLSDARLADCSDRHQAWTVDSSDVRSMALELIAARKRIAELEATLDHISGQNDARVNRIGQLDRRIGELDKEIAAVEEERDELRERIRTLERRSFGQAIIDSLQEFNDSLQCPPVQKLATSGPSITRPVPAVDAWVVVGNGDACFTRWKVSSVETVNGEPRIICGSASFRLSDFRLTGPSDRGPWRPIGEVR